MRPCLCFRRKNRAYEKQRWFVYPLRSAYSPDPSATAKSTVGQEHKTGLNTAAKGPVMSGAAENHPDTHSGTLRPPATLAGAREKAECAEPRVTLLQAQGHGPRQTQELGEMAWVPRPGCPRRLRPTERSCFQQSCSRPGRFVGALPCYTQHNTHFCGMLLKPLRSRPGD